MRASSALSSATVALALADSASLPDVRCAMAPSVWLQFAAIARQVSAHSACAAPAIPEAKVKEEPPKDDASRVMDHHAKLRAEKRKAHEQKLARQRAEHQALERDLVTMIQTDIPSALAELVKAASRFRNKLSDLKHMKKADQWEREAPVKDALARARELPPNGIASILRLRGAGKAPRFTRHLTSQT